MLHNGYKARLFSEVLACTGQFGAGKSALASYVAVEQSKALGVPVWANYDLVGARPVRAIAELYECRRGVLVLDELQSTAHARSFSENQEFTTWFDQVRKQELIFIVITQELAKIDVIIRNMVGYEFNSVALDGVRSQVDVYDIRQKASQRKVNTFVWDRSVAFGLYDDMARAWGLVGSELVWYESARAEVEGSALPYSSSVVDRATASLVAAAGEKEARKEVAKKVTSLIAGVAGGAAAATPAKLVRSTPAGRSLRSVAGGKGS